MVDVHTTFGMDEESPRETTRRGPILLGALLVAVGGAMLAQRMGLLPTTWRTTIWPVLLMTFGAVRLTQPTRHGREGLFFVIAGAWWLASLSGWVSAATTWPTLIIGLGAAITLQGLTRPPRAAGGLGPHGFQRRHDGLTALIIWAIVIGALVSSRGRGLVSATRNEDGNLHQVTVAGRSHQNPEGKVSGGDLVTIVGEGVLDLRAADLAPGSVTPIDVVTLMGNSVIRVPENWIVEIEAGAVFGQIRDNRRGGGDENRRRGRKGSDTSSTGSSGSGGAILEAQAPTPAETPQDSMAPRLVIDGAVIMGELVITSQEPVQQDR